MTDLDEESFVRALREFTGGTNSPIGDDCAVLEVVSPTLLATVDCMVSGVHFGPEATDEQIARKLVGINLSDIAAMGGSPRWALLASARGTVSSDTMFEEQLHQFLNDAGVELVGGDLSSTPSGEEEFFSLTLLGVSAGDHLLRRSAANPGDKIVVSGSLGTIRALLAAEGSLSERERNQLYDPPNRLQLGRAAVEVGVRAAIDLSDGLVKDLGRLIEASGVGARLDPTAIPIGDKAQSRAGSNNQALEWALDGGEDFELLLAAPVDVVEAIETDCPLTVVGEITGGEGIRWDPPLPEGVNTESLGYDHFS